MLAYRPDSTLDIGLQLSGQANTEELHYPAVNQGAANTPDRRRTFAAELGGKWQIGKRLGLQGALSETYHDVGKWYGREYFSTVEGSDSLSLDYYAIQSRFGEFGLRLALLAQPLDKLMLQVGSSLRVVNRDEYDLDSARYAGHTLYVVGPGLKCRWLCCSWLSIGVVADGDLHVKEGDEGKYEVSAERWDARFKVNVRF
jgi:hypothetical protein